MTSNMRVLALLDVENLLQNSPATADGHDYTIAVERAAVAARLTSDTQVVLGFGHNAPGIFGARAAWPNAAIRCLQGKDGGERALLRYAADLNAVARCYDKVVVGSGDRRFTPLVTALSELGVHVCVVSWSSRLAKRLRFATPEFCAIDASARAANEVRHAA